jgi:hypothetical protein
MTIQMAISHQAGRPFARELLQAILKSLCIYRGLRLYKANPNTSWHHDAYSGLPLFPDGAGRSSI